MVKTDPEIVKMSQKLVETGWLVQFVKTSWKELKMIKKMVGMWSKLVDN
jgi:hypothetical protein